MEEPKRERKRIRKSRKKRRMTAGGPKKKSWIKKTELRVRNRRRVLRKRRTMAGRHSVTDITN